MKNSDFVADGDSLDYLRPTEITRLKSVMPEFGRKYNPVIRHIVRRTRNFLEQTIDPSTGEPYLKPVKVKLFGEDSIDSLLLPPYLQDAYKAAEKFCSLLEQRVKGAGFLKTLLLRRMGSTIYAGRQTTEKMLHEWGNQSRIIDPSLFEENDDQQIISTGKSDMKKLTEGERSQLERCLKALESNQERDPKYQKVVEYIVDRNWLEFGCIVFSQYFDSIWWLANQLSGDFPDEPIGIYAGGNNSGII
ncbi:MAG: helicase SNF2, partial [Deltaproteobacteria bacterium]|nr:helicase SNF2 [Deltaproteobacteria bacterium]